MDLQEKSFTELQALFSVTFRDWEENNFQIKRIQEKEIVKYNDFVQNRAELRRLMRENLKLHNLIVAIDLEMQIRVWTGKND